MAIPTISVGDTRHVWRDVYAPDGVPVDISGWTIKLRIRHKPTGTIVVRDAEVDATRTGGMKYQPVAGDVSSDKAGINELQWKLTDTDSKLDSVPNGSVIQLQIIAGVPAS